MAEVKTEIDGIYRDVTNGALLNKDNTALSAYKKMKKKNEELEQMKHKVNNLDDEIKEVKKMLTQIIEKLV